MPCDIGFKNTANIEIKNGEKELKSETEAPKVDEALLELIGERDPAFVEWLTAVDIYPLLGEALGRAVSFVPDSGSLTFVVEKNGKLKSVGTYENRAEKRELQKVNDEVFARFEMEVLKIVLELLGYETIIYLENGEYIIEGEKHSQSRVNKYTRISRKLGGFKLRFEHFESPDELRDERNKFLATAQKLGLDIEMRDIEESGSPIPEGTTHEHFLKDKEKE